MPKLKKDAVDSPQNYPNYIGLICNVDVDDILEKKHPPSWVRRAWILDHALKKEGLHLFTYSPKYVDPVSRKVLGYFIKNNDFILKTSEIPRVNYNWYCGVKKSQAKKLDRGLPYKKFKKWSVKEKILIYPSSFIIDLAKDKYEFYKLIKRFDKKLQLETEIFNRTANQLSEFFKKSNIIILKPRKGRGGVGIFIITQHEDYFSAACYSNNKKTEIYLDETEEILPTLIPFLNNTEYLIQVGCHSLRANCSVISVRVIMLNIEKKWEWITEVHHGSNCSSLSNFPTISSTSYPLEEFLQTLFNAETTNKIIDKIRNSAFSLIEYLDSMCNGNIGELALDYIIDEQHEIYLSEINTKPGIIGKIDYLQSFDQESSYNEKTISYVTRLAKFLKEKLEDYPLIMETSLPDK